MIRRVLVVSLVALGLLGCASVASTSPPSSMPTEGAATPSPAPTGPAGDDPAAIGHAFIDALARGDTAVAEAMEDDAMRAAAPAAALAQLWGQLVTQFGAFEGLGDVETTEQPPYTIATVQATFANASVPLLVTVAGDGRVAGLHLGTPATSPSPAAYVRPDAFTETEVTVGSAPWQLPGTLAMPKGDGPFPAVVLLAGSGPQDRDETIGVNTPLRDLAWGLASAGIATLRYEKRTKEHAAEMAAQAATITVRQETTDDAIAALELLRATPGVDPDRVFLAGHSLGGYLAPRIAAQMGDPPAGIALLEANSSPLTTLILDQVEYLAANGSLGPDSGKPAGGGAGAGRPRRVARPLALDAGVRAAARRAGELLARPAHVRPAGYRARPGDPDVLLAGRSRLPGPAGRAGGVARGAGRPQRRRVP